jgi:CBS domain-containing protein
MDIPVKSVLDKKGHDTFSIRANQSVFEAITEMDAHNVGSLLVKDGDKVVGIITERDYTRKVILKGRASKDTLVETIMTRGLVVVSPTDSVKDAMKLMTERRCRHLPVFDGEQLVGMLSIGDLVKETIAGLEFQNQILEDYIHSR